MVFMIHFSDEARLDLYDFRDYYSKISIESLIKFDQSFTNAVARLESNTENFQKRYRDIRLIIMNVFPYSIHHIQENQTVYIQRVLHQKQIYE